MRSKVIVIGLSLLGASAPAMAQDIEFRPGTGVSAQEISPADDGAVNEIAAKMADPQMQDRIATAVETMTRTVMDMPVGPLVDSIEKARPGTVKRNIPGTPRSPTLRTAMPKRCPKSWARAAVKCCPWPAVWRR